MSSKNKIARGAVVVSSATMVSRILGYVRDMVIARFFGAGMAADAFFVAFRIPNTLRELVGEGALSASFIPVFTEQMGQDKKRDAWKMAASLLNLMVIFLTVVTIIGILLSPYLIRIMAPGFAQIPHKMELTVFLNRLMFPYIFMLSLAALFMGILNSMGHFSTPALSPVFLNIALIICALLLSPRLSQPAVALAIGVLLGGVGQLALQFIVAFKKGFRFMKYMDIRNPSLRRVLLLMLPSSAGLAVSQVNHFVSTFLASFLQQGSVSYLFYSMRMVSLPNGLIGVALGTVILPTFSEVAARKDMGELRENFSFALRLSFFMTLPVLVIYLFFGVPMIQVLFERGLFDRQATLYTAQALLYYSLGLIFTVSNRIMIPTFYALQDTKTPVKISMITVASNVGLSIALVYPLSFCGLALATSLSSLLSFILLLWYLRKKVGRLDGKKIFRSWSKTVAASAAMALAAILYVYFVPIISHPRLLVRAFWLALGFILSAGVYTVVAYLLKSGELLNGIQLLKRKAGRVTPTTLGGDDEL